MQTKSFLKYFTLFLAVLFFYSHPISAQEQSPLDLQTATELALQNNHLLKVKQLQVSEKLGKMKEDKVKYLPVVGIGGSYQYNTNLPGLTLTQGEFGELPVGGITIPFPFIDEVIVMGKHNIYNAGVTIYQPLTQLGKIGEGVNVSIAELQITETEEKMAVCQVKQTVEKLYFGLLILNKQIEEAGIRVKLAETRLHEVESALAAGKIIESNRFGLAASAASEEQNLLRLKIQSEDLSADFKQITGITTQGDLDLLPLSPELLNENSIVIDTSFLIYTDKNNDYKIASLRHAKAEHSVRASNLSYLPDIGFLGGYTYQEGAEIYPKNNAFVGASLKWNLQDLFLNRSIHSQRVSMMQQAEENMANTKEQVLSNIGKTIRKISQARELIAVAGKAVNYRKEDLKMKTDRRNAGLNLESELLEAMAEMAKAESDLLSAQLNYRIAITDFNILTGSY